MTSVRHSTNMVILFSRTNLLLKIIARYLIAVLLDMYISYKINNSTTRHGVHSLTHSQLRPAQVYADLMSWSQMVQGTCYGAWVNKYTIKNRPQYKWGSWVFPLTEHRRSQRCVTFNGVFCLHLSDMEDITDHQLIWLALRPIVMFNNKALIFTNFSRGILSAIKRIKSRRTHFSKISEVRCAIQEPNICGKFLE